MGQTSQQLNNYINDNELLKKANQLAYRYMSVLKRKEAGKTMYNHVYDVTKQIFEIGVTDVEILAAALLHDIVEDSVKSMQKDESLTEPITKDYLKIHFGKKVSDIVENLSNISSENIAKRYKEFKNDQDKYVYKRMNYVKDFMKHLLAATKLNILENLFLIKFFDRFHNMQTLHYHGSEYQQHTIAKETFDIYIPLFYMVQSIPLEYVYEMESIAFQFMYPEIHKNRELYIKENGHKIIKEVEEIKSFLKNKNYADKVNVIPRARTPYRLHLTKSNFSGVNYAIYDIIIVADEPTEEEYEKMGKEESLKIKLETEKRLYELMVDLIHHPLIDNKKKFSRHYLIQNDAFKYSLNFHYSQAYIRPLPAMRINLFSNKNNIMFQLNLTTKNKLNEHEKRRNIRDWIKTLKSVEDNIITDSQTAGSYERLRVDFLKPVTLYTPKGDYFHLPATATLRDFAFRIHTHLGINASYALVNQIERFSLSEPVKPFHGNIVQIEIEDEKAFEKINFSEIYSEVTLASSEKKVDEYLKRHLKEKFGLSLSEDQLMELSKMFKDEIKKTLNKDDY
ncbi:bifunctional (p)ppGpp synthetase/guanosine-3',5'-bis(diphosphate) 3'-pyrophosphohydrolase [bacterium]|nr:bifunctional (p)ppGpp synthetase/guanosine-3',5'-bis(diphosphate) 3'-pyrophosphohydrolase [bacterium]